MPGNTRIMTYDDIIKAEQKRAAKVGITGAKRGRGRPKSLKTNEGKGSYADKLKINNREIQVFRSEEYCSILQF
jgi:hypothetical protein